MGSKPLRLAILSPINRDPKVGNGGIAPFVINLAEDCAKEGILVDLLQFTNKTPYYTPDFANMRLVSLGEVPKLYAAFRLARYLKQEKPVALLAAGGRANMVAGFAKRFFNQDIPVWIGIHTTLSESLAQETFLKRLSNICMMRLAYSAADGLIAVSKGVAEDLARLRLTDKARIHVIYNPVVQSSLYKKAQAPIEHRWFGEKIPLILAAGRLMHHKGFSTLIEAFALLRQRQKCRLLILGEGKTRPLLEEQVQRLGLKDDVDMPGLVPNPYPYMAHADLLVLSSTREGLPTVLIEAMALGVPVVSTDCPSGPREILEDGKYGMLVPMNDARRLADAMEKTLANPPAATFLQEGVKRFMVSSSAQSYRKLLFSKIPPKHNENHRVIGKHLRLWR